MRSTRLAVGVVAALVVVGLAGKTDAQDLPGDPSDGRRLAQAWCSNCHVIDSSAKSSMSSGAPTFAAIATTPGLTEMSLQVFLQTPHTRMPDLHLSRQEINDLLAFIKSQRKS